MENAGSFDTKAGNLKLYKMEFCKAGISYVIKILVFEIGYHILYSQNSSEFTTINLLSLKVYVATK